MCSFAVIASPESLAHRQAATSGMRVTVLDPLRAPDANMIGPLQPPTHGADDASLPRWAVYDCAEVPGAVIGLLRDDTPTPAPTPLDPLAIILATPHAEDGAWHLYGLNVCHSASDARGVRLRLIAGAIRLLNARQTSLVVPWSAPWLDRLCELGSLELLCARTALHLHDPSAALMLHDRNAPTLRSAAREDLTIPLESDDLHLVLDRMQDVIETGSRLFLSCPSTNDTQARVLVREVPP